jgi:hypothetical protein
MKVLVNTGNPENRDYGHYVLYLSVIEIDDTIIEMHAPIGAFQGCSIEGDIDIHSAILDINFDASAVDFDSINDTDIDAMFEGDKIVAREFKIMAVLAAGLQCKAVYHYYE